MWWMYNDSTNIMLFEISHNWLHRWNSRDWRGQVNLDIRQKVHIEAYKGVNWESFEPRLHNLIFSGKVSHLIHLRLHSWKLVSVVLACLWVISFMLEMNVHIDMANDPCSMFPGLVGECYQASLCDILQIHIEYFVKWMKTHTSWSISFTLTPTFKEQKCHKECKEW